MQVRFWIAALAASLIATPGSADGLPPGCGRWGRLATTLADGLKGRRDLLLLHCALAQTHHPGAPQRTCPSALVFGMFRLDEARDREALRAVTQSALTEGKMPEGERFVAALVGRSPAEKVCEVLRDPSALSALETAFTRGESGKLLLREYESRLAQRLEQPQRLLSALSQLNPKLQAQADFLRTYAGLLIEHLGDFDDLLDAVEGRSPHVCNLLCRDRIVPAFRFGRRFTATDLPRYVLTSTCYGFLPDEQARRTYLRELEAALAVTVAPGGLPLDTQDKHFWREDLGDLKQEGTVRNGVPLFPFPIITRSNYPTLHQIRVSAGAGRGVDRRYRPLDAATLAAAEAACGDARRLR